MLKTILSRFLQGVFALFCVLTLTFFLSRFTPGNPFDNEKQIPEHIRAKISEAWGLDQPLVVQWGKSMLDAARGFPQPSFGNSGFTVREVIAQSFPVSFLSADLCDRATSGYSLRLRIGLVSCVGLGGTDRYCAAFRDSRPVLRCLHRAPFAEWHAGHALSGFHSNGQSEGTS